MPRYHSGGVRLFEAGKSICLQFVSCCGGAWPALGRPRILRGQPGRPFIFFSPAAFFGQARLALQFATQRANHDVQHRGRRRAGGQGEARQQWICAPDDAVQEGYFPEQRAQLDGRQRREIVRIVPLASKVISHSAST